MQLHLTPTEILHHLASLGFTPESLLTSKEARNLAREAVNKHCGTKWTNGRLIQADGRGAALWTLYTANKGQFFDLTISQ